MITEMNNQMAVRMLKEESMLGQKNMRKSLEQYERIKRTMINNKRAMSTHNVRNLPVIPLKKSKIQLNLRAK